MQELRAVRAKRKNLDVQRVEELLHKRGQARAAKDFALSDALRQELQEMGVSVRDTPDGQTWDTD